MPRRRWVVLPGVAHHVTQRGNNRQDIFVKDMDFSNYCFWVNEYAREYQVDVLAYCLMNDHVHFIVVPQDPDGLARLF
jgi:putative transposase